MKPPFRAEHVGSFPRPERLVQARDAHLAGKLPREELTRIEDECVREVAAMQERVGIGALTDGEYRKSGWHQVLFDNVEGFGELAEHDFSFTQFDGSSFKPPGAERIAVAKLKRRSSIAADGFVRLKAMTSKPCKANLPTPSAAHAQTGPGAYNRAYPDLASYLGAIAAIYREEIADLAARGCTYLQMDEVPLALLCDPRNREIVKRRGEDPEALVDAYIGAINDSVRDRPKDMTVCIHMCRGNIGHGMASGGYEPIAEKLFNRANVDGFFLEYDTPRAGDFSPLRYLPKSKRAVLGLLTTKKPDPEPADELARRIEEAARYCDLDQLALSPQCGFSSTAVRRPGRLAIDDVERKLARVVEVARRVWG